MIEIIPVPVTFNAHKHHFRFLIHQIGIWKNIPKDRDKLLADINELAVIAQTQDHSKIAQKIKELVPTYIGNSNHLN